MDLETTNKHVLVGMYEVFESEKVEDEVDIFLELPLQDTSPLQSLVQDNMVANIQSLISTSTLERNSSDESIETAKG